MKKKIRVVLALFVGSFLSLYFLDFAGLVPDQFHLLSRVQLVPALLALNIVSLLIIFAITILFGRIYCSVICPLGILQDVVDWMAKKFHRKKKYPSLRERPVLRWSVVAITVLAFTGGLSLIVSLLDPYSAYGRIASSIFKPVYLFGHNIIATIDNYFESYHFYKTGIFLNSLTALLVSALTLGIVGLLSYKWGRLYCNTICPVGTVLGLVSRFSIFRIRINNETCNSCGLCAMKCKSSCIDASTKSIDYSRCVSCFNCLEVCRHQAMSFSVIEAIKPPAVIAVNETGYRAPRRTFIAFVVAGVATVQKLFARQPDTTKKIREIYTSHNIPYRRKHPVTPPGSTGVRRYNDRCTGCHLCVSKCPSNVLKPAFMEYGLVGMLQPTMEFQHGYCNYHCTECTEICPSGALEKITEKEKKTLSVGHVHYIKENCVVVTDDTDCGACSEHCPTQAVSMKPYKGTLTIPEIDQDLCVGCGGCEYICPTRPYRAIYVVGYRHHKQAKIPEEVKQKKVEVQDFGF